MELIEILNGIQNIIDNTNPKRSTKGNLYYCGPRTNMVPNISNRIQITAKCRMAQLIALSKNHAIKITRVSKGMSAFDFDYNNQHYYYWDGPRQYYIGIY